MTHSIHRTILPAVLTALVVLAGCDSNDLEDDNLTGTYQLQSWTDKSGDIATPGQTYIAGTRTMMTITEDGESIEVGITVTGSLSIQESSYTVTMQAVLDASQNGQSFTETESFSESGSWSESNGRITFSGSASGEDQFETLDYLLDGDQLYLENTETRFVFERR